MHVQGVSGCRPLESHGLPRRWARPLTCAHLHARRRHQSGWLGFMRPHFAHQSSNHSKLVLGDGDFPFFAYDPSRDPLMAHEIRLPGHANMTQIEKLK